MLGDLKNHSVAHITNNISIEGRFSSISLAKKGVYLLLPCKKRVDILPNLLRRIVNENDKETNRI